MTSILARLDGVERRFGSVRALAGADLRVESGEIHALLGENGAGKSTLLGVLGGLVRPDAGLVEIGGRRVALSGPRDAWAHGIGLVHQHFMLVPALTALENLALGRTAGRAGFRSAEREVRARAEALVQRTGLDVPLDVRVEDLGVGHKQRLEILKALLREPRILALDEPTASLAPAEVASLFGLLRDLARHGTGVLLVAHKIDEVLAIADRVTVLRRGSTTLTAARAEVDARSLVRAMVGRDLEDRAGAGARGSNAGHEVAVLHGVTLCDRSGRAALDSVSLTVRRGEIVGVAGVEGNGQRELALLLSGRLAGTEGRVHLPGGVGFIPQDRTREGLIGELDLSENLALALHRDSAFVERSTIRWSDVRARAADVISRFGVVAPGPGVPAGTLSGGNQQRLILGRELTMATDLLVAENPARGLDVAATAFAHDELRRLRDTPGGPGIVLVSNDLDEVLRLSDRVFVMLRGRLLAVPDAERTREGVGALMLGGASAVA